MLKKGDVFYYPDVFDSDEVKKYTVNHVTSDGEVVKPVERSVGFFSWMCFREKENANAYLEKYRADYRERLRDKDAFIKEIMGYVAIGLEEFDVRWTEVKVLEKMLKERVT